jgi:hypothetical protein
MLSRKTALEAAMLSMPDQMEEIYQTIVSAALAELGVKLRRRSAGCACAKRSRELARSPMRSAIQHTRHRRAAAIGTRPGGPQRKLRLEPEFIRQSKQGKG